ncbi:MAG: SAM-dependent methyltransferase [Bacteroidetes bacterium]|nr:MAG: SAM-dependent methyltransferase [Bacteroidota bacterium]
MKTGTIYLIPSAIAKGVSQNTVTPQVKEALLSTKFFVAEHVREARRFISSLRLGITIEELIFSELNKRTSAEQIHELLQPAFEGNSLGVLSDAGCPGIADPGADIAREAHNAGLKVVPLVGPSSIVLALMASGLSGQNFRFTGYLPIDKKDLKNKIISLESQSRREKETQIFIETPYRSDRLLLQLVANLNPTTLLTVAKDLTGANEHILTMPVSDWKKYQMVIGKTPTVFLFMAM